MRNEQQAYKINKYAFVSCFFVVLAFSIHFKSVSIDDLYFGKIYPGFLWRKMSLLTLSDVEEGEDFIYYPDYNSSYTQLITKNSTKSICFYSSAVGREYSRYVHLTNAFCTSAKAVGKGETLYWIGTAYFTKQLPTCGIYDSIVFLYSPWGNIFAHWIQDCLPALLFIPSEIINRSKIMISFKPEPAMTWLKYFGINYSQIIYKRKAWCYTKNLYMYYSIDPVHGLTIHSFAKLRDFLRNRFQVDSIKATRYVFSNKKRHEARSISNLEEFLEYTKENLPQYNWEWDDWDYSLLSNVAQVVASIKILVAPSGSKIFYEIFMNQDYQCGICLISSMYMDCPNYALGLAYKIWQIGYCHNVTHWITWWPCDIEFGFTCVKRLLHAVEYGYWPEDTFEDMKEVFDMNKIFEDSKKNVNKLIRIDNECCGEAVAAKMKKMYGDNFE